MRTSLALVALVLAACGNAPSDRAIAPPDAPAGHATVAGGSPSPIVGTLRLRGRDVVLTAEALEAAGNEELRRMTARTIMADVDSRVGGEPEVPAIQADL